MGLFFMSVGMTIDLQALLQDTFWIFGSVLGLLLIKSLVVAAIFRAYGLPTGTAVEAGLLLGQGSEFAFIVMEAAILQGWLSPEIGQFMLLVVGLSMLISPVCADLGKRLGKLLNHRFMSAEPSPQDVAWPAMEGHVVIAGFGRVGQMLGRILDTQGIPYVAVDHNPKLVEQFFSLGGRIYYGDASRAELLKRAHVDKARAVVVTMDQMTAAQHAVRTIRQHHPEMPIFARAKDEKHASVLKQIGATQVVPEALEASLQLAGFVLAELSLPHEASALIIEQHRQSERLFHGTGAFQNPPDAGAPDS
jgi:CPA2 family monovalent cation:H+ antiporter-2